MNLKLTLLAGIIALAGCTKTKTADEIVSGESAMRIGAVTSSSDFDSRVQMYNLLTSSEKFEMWRTHLQKAKNQFAIQGTFEKVSLTTELLSKLQTTVFEKDSRDAVVFHNYFIPVWGEKARKIFTDSELYDLTFNPTADVIGEVTAREVDPEGEPAKCFCHVGTSGYSCRKISVGFPSGVTITNGICENTGPCETTSSGCGFFWWYSCNGNHCNF